jgi:predicted membrane protein
MNTISELMNNFNGISLAIIMVLSYCAVLKNTKRHESETRKVFNRKYQ